MSHVLWPIYGTCSLQNYDLVGNTKVVLLLSQTPQILTVNMANQWYNGLTVKDELSYDSRDLTQLVPTATEKDAAGNNM